MLREIPQSAIRLSRSLLHQPIPVKGSGGALLLAFFGERIETSKWQMMTAELGQETFNEFLWLDGQVRNDSATEAYLGYCSATTNRHIGIVPAEIRRFNAIVFERQYGLVKQTKDGKIRRRSAEEMIDGFFKFVDFCIELDDFLDVLNDEPEAQTRYVAFYVPYLDGMIMRATREILSAIHVHDILAASGLGRDWQLSGDLSEVSRNDFEQGIRALQKCEERVRLRTLVHF